MTHARALTNNYMQPYMAINREERNLAAVLYATLLVNDNLTKLLDLVDYNLPVEPSQTVAYFEYAFLRDLWDQGGLDNAGKRNLGTELLGTADVHSLSTATTSEWNEHFGCGGKTLSIRHVQSPGSWALTRYDANIQNDADFLATTRFKWCWNTKPDLVVHTTLEHALVIEAKLESGEGRYPSSAADRAIFARRGLASVSQTELQQHMFDKLLGIQILPLFVVKKPGAVSLSHKQVRWHEIFEKLDLTGLPSFVGQWFARYAT